MLNYFHQNKMNVNCKKYLVDMGEIPNWDTLPEFQDDDYWKDKMDKNVRQIRRIQEKLYAQRRFSLLINLQGMDTSGKDSLIRKVFGPLNPAGVKVHSFKKPTSEENSHDYLWRHYKKLPAKGEITVFNRTHYENVLVTRVHPQYILPLQIPGVDTIDDIDDDFWNQRFRQINQAEKTWVENGMIVLKFFLNISPEIQKERLLARLDNPDKHWKFEASDIAERKHWEKYMDAYQSMLQETSFNDRPWYVIPADSKPFARFLVSEIVLNTLKKYPIDFPEADTDFQENINQFKKDLEKSLK
jgi:PPK2 family polyphosphate:nucleotide phosphotransferase